MFKGICKALFLLAIIVLTTILIMMAFVPFANSAEITSDHKNTITIDGSIKAGDVSKLNKALGEINILAYARLDIIIDSGGGEADVTVSMMYVLKRWSIANGKELRTIVYSKAYSGGAMLFLVGDERLVGPEANIMFHEVSFYFPNGQRIKSTDVKKLRALEVPEHAIISALLQNKLTIRMLKERTTLPLSAFEKETYIFQKTALKYGVAMGRIKPLI